MSQTTIDRADAPDHEPGTDLSPDGSVAGGVDTAPTAAPDEPSAEAQIDQLRRDMGRHDIGIGLLLGLAFVVMIASVIAVGLIQRNSDDGGGAAAAPGQTISAELSEFAVSLSASDVTPNSTITVTNSGAMAHTLGVLGTDIVTASIPPGGTATLDLSGLEPGDYTLYCDIPGHVESGMKAPLTIGDGSAAASDAAAMGMTAEEHAAMSGGDHAAMTPEEGMAMDQAMMESVMAFPAATEGLGNQPLEPTILADGTKHFELTTSIVDWEVAPGEIVQAWAYNGQVPGPRIDVAVGDTVELELTNELPVGTDIHMHGIDLPNDQDGVAPITQDLVATGETYTYRFTATEPAIGMYHAHAHGDQAIPNGLFGTMYVGEVAPPAGRTVSGIAVPADLTIAQDIPMVVNDAGTIGLTLNGKSFPATAPLVVDEGDWVTVTYFNEGLQVHPMHLHGFEQIVYAKDGEPLD
ncbi:MAG TPA: multicopper oxidase domain-containing protein, partial [Ilumatobacteraceae bacterium]|nr:multicopper oxidase domain-containing protein [Ilumatobacteraceae bacterium]